MGITDSSTIDRGAISSASPTTNRVRQIRGLLVFTFLTSLIMFGFFEVILRIYLRSHIFYDIEMTRYSNLLKIESDNPLIGHEHRPSSSATLMGVSVEINSDGLRDREYPVQRAGNRRIVFLGDSLTLGWGVKREDTFEYLLEEKLNASAPTEVLNFGTGNYNTVQETNLFLKKGLKYQPDQVVLFYFINDAEPVPQASRWGFLGHSRFITFYWSRFNAMLNNLSATRDFRSYYAGFYGEDRPGWQAAKEAFIDLKKICDEKKIDLKVVILPELHDLIEYPFRREHGMVSSFLSASGIRHLDLLPAFQGYSDPQKLWVSLDDAHPNAIAHKKIAEHTLDFISERKGENGFL